MSKNAISFIDNNEGFLYPNIDLEKCTNCGLCLNVCPINEPPKVARAQTGYVGWIKDKDVLLKSSSGGIFFAVAQKVLDEGGYVCGCVNDDNCLPQHIISRDINDVLRMQGSKYVESNIGDVYNKIDKLLREGFLVLFVGTLCQVAGLRKFVKKTKKVLFA